MVLARTVRRHIIEAANDLAAADAFGSMGDGVIRDLVAVVGDNPLFGALEDCVSGERRYRRMALCRMDQLSKGLWAIARGRRSATVNSRRAGTDHNTSQSQLALPIGTDRTPRPNGFVRPWAVGTTILGLGAAVGYWLAESWTRARNEWWPATNWDGVAERALSWGCGLAIAAIALGSLAIAARRPRVKGFTLVELLVVTSIMSTLAGIMLPGFASSREQARQAACMGNVRQLALGLLQYADDHDGMLPPAYRVDRRTRTYTTWQTTIGLKALRCPSRSATDATHYGYNAALQPPVVATACDPGTPLVGDAMTATVRSGSTYQSWWPAHISGANVAHVDGHVGIERSR